MLKKWGTKKIVVIGVVGTNQGACLFFLLDGFKGPFDRSPSPPCPLPSKHVITYTGLHKLMQHHPDITVHVAAIDDAVDEVRKAIAPGCRISNETRAERLTCPFTTPYHAVLCQQDGHIVPGIGDASERIFNVHMSHDDDDAASVISNKKPKGGNGNA